MNPEWIYYILMGVAALVGWLAKTRLQPPAPNAPATRPPASSAAARATRSHMVSGSGAISSLATTTKSSGCQVRRATPMMHDARGSVICGRVALRRATCRAWRSPGRR